MMNKNKTTYTLIASLFITCITSITVAQQKNDGHYLEMDGILVLEAENYNEKIDKTPTNGTQQKEHAWTFGEDYKNYSGTGYMSNLPDEQCETCSTHNSPKDGSGAELVYNVKILTPGKYYVWMRGWSLGGESNGVHIQVDGEFAQNSAGTNMSGFRPHKNWTWEHGHKDYAHEPILNLTEGYHTIHVYGRDDGFSLDKIVLGIDQTKAPSGSGPEESSYIEKIGMGNMPDIKVDKLNNIHVVYARNKELYYRKRDANTGLWSAEEPTGLKKGANKYFVTRVDPDIVIDSDNNPHVHCWNTYAYKSNDKWTEIVPIDADKNNFRDTELAIDNNDNIYLIKRGGLTGGNLGVQKYNKGATSWTNLTDPDEGLTTPDISDHVYPDIAIDKNNKLHIVQRHGPGKTTYYHSSDDGGKSWEHSKVTSKEGESPFIEVLSDGTPVVMEATGYFYKFDDDKWVDEGRVIQCNDRELPELCVDGNDNVYCATFGFKYNIMDNGSWGSSRTLKGKLDNSIGFVETAALEYYAYAVWEEGKYCRIYESTEEQPTANEIKLAVLTPYGDIISVDKKPEAFCKIASPAYNERIDNFTDVVVNIEAWNPWGIEKMKFYLDGKLKQELTEPPYTYNFGDLSEGKYRIDVRMISNQGDSIPAYTYVDIFYKEINSTNEDTTNNPTTGLKKNDAPQKDKIVKMYPNPFHDEFQIEILNNSKNLNIELYDLSHRKIFTRHILSASQGDYSVFSTQNLLPGIYILKLRDENSHCISKIIKK